MIIPCGYKQNNYCDYGEKDLNSTDDCIDCHYAVPVYTIKDRVSMLYEAIKNASKEKSIKVVSNMVGVFGHYVMLSGDFDDLYYTGYSIYLLLRKKYKWLTDFGLVSACEAMKYMGIKIPKGVKRKYRRFKKNHFEVYKAIVRLRAVIMAKECKDHLGNVYKSFFFIFKFYNQ